jgi:hypothetical protein
MAASSSIPDRIRHAPSDRGLTAEEGFGREALGPAVLGRRTRTEFRRVPRRRRLRKSRFWLRLGLAAAMAVVLVYWTGRRDDRTDAPAPSPPASLLAPPPAWQPLAQAAPLYAVEGADGTPAAALARARAHSGGGREDSLTFGTFGQAGYAYLGVAHGPTEPDAPRFYVDLVRRAAGLGLSVLRSGLSEAIATKFGTVEAASVTFGESVEQACLAFRFSQDGPAFKLHGWLCGSDELPVTTGQLVCFLDRVVLAQNAADPELKALFAQADRRRLPACAPPQAPPRSAAAKRS